MKCFRPIFVGASVLSLVGFAPPAHADGTDKLACIDAHEKVQLLRNKHALREARAELLICSRETCPTLIRRECAPWLVEVEATIPSVLLVAQGPDGSEINAVRVLVDGALLAESIDTNAIELDPGTHQFRFEGEGFEPVARTVELRPGDKNRRVEVRLAPTQPSGLARSTRRHVNRPRVVASESHSSHTPAYVASGVAILGLGSFGFFAVRGRVLESDRAGSCAPRCSDTDVQPVRTSYTIADVSLGVAAVSAAVATYFFIHESPSRRSGVRRRPSDAIVRF